jgi:hypothetical protein
VIVEQLVANQLAELALGDSLAAFRAHVEVLRVIVHRRVRPTDLA